LVGGGGLLTGLGVIFTSACIGLVYRRVSRLKPKKLTSLHLFAFGMVVHLSMLLWMLTIPWPLAFTVIKKIAFSVLILYPIATVLLGKIIAGQEYFMDTEKSLVLSEEKFKQFFKNSPEHCYMVSPAGEIMDINKSALNTLGYEKKELIGKPLLTKITRLHRGRKLKISFCNGKKQDCLKMRKCKL
jgi:PAS domain-containing protein